MVITRGVYTQLVVHLEDYDFSGITKVILTIKNELEEKPVVVREYSTPEEIVETISPEEAERLYYNKKIGHGSAFYDFDAILSNGNRIKISKNGNVDIVKGVGDIND